MMEHTLQNKIKQAIGKFAADLVMDGMIVGLGTGSTSACFIESLAIRCSQGLKIRAIATSQKSTDLAKSKGIPILDMEDVVQIDLTIDGADEIDHQKRLIKGGGGALLREKIIATSSKEMIVIVDESKIVKDLGAFGLPVEIIPFCYKTTLHKLSKIGFTGKLRTNPDGTFYITDNSNYIVDIHFDPVCRDPEKAYTLIRCITGVVDIGFFFHIAKRVVVGYADGSVKIYAGDELPFKTG
ncbi:MAG: ribose-5-phosphate isomerase RpiA [Chlamydiales bacterium]|nr:ribose-5-phosphate isomerase RpiA [Chlamydiales bacterium]